MDYCYINRPVVDMREAPLATSKVVSQAIFSEKIEIQKKENDWSFAMTPDHYTGWLPSNSIAKRKNSFDSSLQITRLMAHVYRLPDIEYGSIFTLPYSSKLHALSRIDDCWTKVAFSDEQEGYVQNGDIALEKPVYTQQELVLWSFRFLGLPYTWGGRSSFGYDCSGFVQMLYNRIGIDLQRDARQQILDDRFQNATIQEIELGDLIFFGKSEQEIKHVGMYIGNGKFIHTSSREYLPWCRISRLSDLEWNGQANAYFPFRIVRKLIRGCR